MKTAMIFIKSHGFLVRLTNAFNFFARKTPSPSIPPWPETVATPPSRGREAKPLSLEGREVGERVVVKQSPFSNMVLIATLSFAAFFTACSSTPPPPDWQMNAQGSMERSIEGYLVGNARVEAAEFARAKSEIARTGRADLMARVELMRCAARVASLVQDECEGFEKLRPDAAAAERAYADYLAGRAVPDASLLPPQHRAITNEGAIQNIADPLSRLVAAGVIFRRGEASPALLSTAVETASAQGWRRPLLAWLGVQLIRAEKAADVGESDRLRRRIALVENAPAVESKP
jgi:hypothetical protein